MTGHQPKAYIGIDGLGPFADRLEAAGSSMAPDQQAPDIRATRSPWQHDERLRVITDALPVGIAYVDQDKIYRFTNDRFAAAYGLTREEIVGKHADEFIWRDAMTLGDPFFEAAHRGHPVDFTHPVRHADGRLLSVRTFLRPDIVADGSVAGFYVCSINVTQQKEAEIAVLQAQKMDAVGQLASGIAHDFNNLLAIMLGNLVPLREVLADEAVVKEYVDPAVRAAGGIDHIGPDHRNGGGTGRSQQAPVALQRGRAQQRLASCRGHPVLPEA